MTKIYYDVCDGIDRHNRQRQYDLELERIAKTVTWWKRVCMSFFGIIFVDTKNFYSEVVHQSEVDETPDDFFTKLAHEMIFNDIDRPAPRRRRGLDRHSPGSPGTGKKQKRLITYFCRSLQDQGLPHEVDKSVSGLH